MTPSAALSRTSVASESPRSARSTCEIALAVTPARSPRSCWLSSRARRTARSEAATRLDDLRRRQHGPPRLLVPVQHRAAHGVVAALGLDHVHAALVDAQHALRHGLDRLLHRRRRLAGAHRPVRDRADLEQQRAAAGEELARARSRPRRAPCCPATRTAAAGGRGLAEAVDLAQQVGGLARRCRPASMIASPGTPYVLTAPPSETTSSCRRPRSGSRSPGRTAPPARRRAARRRCRPSRGPPSTSSSASRPVLTLGRIALQALLSPRSMSRTPRFRVAGTDGHASRRCAEARNPDPKRCWKPVTPPSR